MKVVSPDILHKSDVGGVRVGLDGPDAVAASFVDVLAEKNPEKLAELARLIRRKLRESDSK